MVCRGLSIDGTNVVSFLMNALRYLKGIGLLEALL
jgi:hypothetical protein